MPVQDLRFFQRAEKIACQCMRKGFCGREAIKEFMLKERSRVRSSMILQRLCGSLGLVSAFQQIESRSRSRMRPMSILTS